MSSDLRIRREAITILDDPPGSQLDIVFVHGLDGHPYESWTDESSRFYWPLEMSKITPVARTMTFGYNANFDSGGRNHMGIRQFAESLLLNLRNNRQRSLQGRPLVFVCHSLGGLVAKQALILSSRRPPDSSVLESTKLMVFLGTPHQGSNLLRSKATAAAEMMAKVASHEIPPRLRHLLTPQNDELFSINEDFTGVKREIFIINFYEQKEMRFLPGLVVDKNSAVLHYENIENIPLHRDHRELVRFKDTDDDAYRQIHETIQRKLSSILSIKSSKETGADTCEMLRACLASLQSVVSDNRVNKIAEPSENTLDWLWDEKTGFTSWLAQGKGLYWIGGKPGSGKSVLMKEICWRLQRDSRGLNSVVARYFFDNRSTALEKSFEGFLRSIIEQILNQKPALFELVADEFRDYWNAHYYSRRGDVRWTLRNLKDTLSEIVSRGSCINTLYLVVDALDECVDMSLTGFSIYFEQLMRCAQGMNVKICFSSRLILEKLLNIDAEAQGFVLQEKNSADIVNFVNSRWAGVVPANEDSKDLEDIKHEIIGKADGVFLWVNVVLSQIERGLEHGNTVSELRQSLTSIPSRLSGLWCALLDQVDSAYMAETNTMLSLVLCASRPLTLTEFRYVMTFCTEKVSLSQSDMQSSKDVIQTDTAMIKRIRSRCGGLLEVKTVADAADMQPPFGRIVQFIHQSVKDYFLSQEREIDSRTLSSVELIAHGHKKFVRACLQYLRINELRGLPARLEGIYHIDESERRHVFAEEFPLLDYSACYWVPHYCEVEKLGVPQYEYLELFIQPSESHFDIWYEVYIWLEETRGCIIDVLGFHQHLESSPLQLAMGYNLPDFARRQIEKGQDVNAPVDYWGSYLFLAAYRGHEDIVELLLRHGAEVDVGRVDATPLVAACSAGHAGVVRTLLKWGADVSSSGLYTNPLSAAAGSGNFDVLQALLDHCPEVFQNTWNRHCALGTSLHYWNSLRQGITFHEANPGSYVERVMFGKKRTDLARIVNLLTSQGVDPDVFGFATPWMQWLMIYESGESEETLTERNAELESRHGYGATLLHYACLYGNGEAARRLIERGANIEARIEGEWAILHAAASNRLESALLYLLSLGLDPNFGDDNGTTPLQLAAARGSDAHLEALLAAKADVTAVDSRNCVALHYAVSNCRITNQYNILDALMPAGINANTVACTGLTPLHLAARHGSISSVQWLLDKGANLNAIDDEGRTALHAAAANGKDITGGTLDLLVCAGLSVTAQDDSGMTPLHSVLNYYDGPFERNSNPFNKGCIYTAPPSVQAYKVKIRLLLQLGASINTQDNGGNTALHLACAKGSSVIVRLLLDEGASPGVRDIRGCRPVDLAQQDNVRALLENATRNAT